MGKNKSIGEAGLTPPKSEQHQTDEPAEQSLGTPMPTSPTDAPGEQGGHAQPHPMQPAYERTVPVEPQPPTSRVFTVRGNRLLDLDKGEEADEGDELFFYENQPDLPGAEIGGNHAHPDGTVGPITFTDGSGIVGKEYVTATPLGNVVRWRVLSIGNSEEKDNFHALTIEILDVSAPQPPAAEAPPPTPQPPAAPQPPQEQAAWKPSVGTKAGYTGPYW